NKIDCETLFSTFKRSGLKSSYIGAKYVQGLFLTDKHWQDFVSVEDHDQQKHQHTQPWPFFFEGEEEGQKKLENYLGDVSDKNVSFFAYSTISDHIIHNDYTVYKGKNFTESAQHAVLVYERIGFMKKWIDDHPDVLLIIASDHGHDEMVDYRCETHGTGLNNNTGWQILYNPLFSSEKSFEMESLDIAATISNYIKTGSNNLKQINDKDVQQGYINIPANNMGIARNLFEQSSDNLRAKKQSLAQMINLFDETKNNWEYRGQWKQKLHLNHIDENDQYNKEKISEQIKLILDSNSETMLKRKAEEEVGPNEIYKYALSHYKHIKEQAENAHIQLFQAINQFDVPTSKIEVYWLYAKTNYWNISAKLLSDNVHDAVQSLQRFQIDYLIIFVRFFSFIRNLLTTLTFLALGLFCETRFDEFFYKLGNGLHYLVLIIA
ncbi:MAG: hypothetical protein EZS28_029194, partial [Streblomastix strix]